MSLAIRSSSVTFTRSPTPITNNSASAWIEIKMAPVPGITMLLALACSTITAAAPPRKPYGNDVFRSSIAVRFNPTQMLAVPSTNGVFRMFCRMTIKSKDVLNPKTIVALSDTLTKAILKQSSNDKASKQRKETRQTGCQTTRREADPPQ